MSIRPYKNRKGILVPGKWCIDYWPNGRKGPHIRNVLKCDEAEAQEVERKLRQAHYKKPVSVNPRVIDIYPEFMDWLKLHRSERYHEDMESAFKQLRPFFAHIQFSKKTPKLINDYKKNRPRPSGKHSGFKGSCAINKELRYLGRIIRWANQNGYAAPLPFRIERLPYKKVCSERR